MTPTQSSNNNNRTVVPQQTQTDNSLTVLIDTQPAENALPIGTRLRELEIINIIGWGGFGIVYLVYDHSLQRQVALKEYMPSALARRESNKTTVVVKSELHKETFLAGLHSFINEARLLANFDHPSLVKVYQFWESNGTAYMVMPFYQGITLKEKLKVTDQPPEEAWLKLFLAHLIDALSVIHKDHCYHRDISPDNILILSDGRPLLLDFGAARRVISDMTQTLTVILKPGYAPIEQYGEVATMSQGPWTDIYALAAVIYFTITGKTPTTSVSRMISDTLIPLSEAAAGRYNPAFLKSIDQALSIKPQDRPQNINEFRALLDLPEQQATTIHTGITRFINNKPTQTSTPNGGKRTAVFYVTATVTLIAAIGIGAWVYEKSTKQLAGNPFKSIKHSITALIDKRKVFDPINALDDIFDKRDHNHAVTVSVRKTQVRIGIDPLRFEIRSARPGYVYVLMVGTNRSDFFLLFPNAADKDNHIEAGGKLNLPRATWKMIADGPPGTNQFIAIVSSYPRSFTHAGISAIDPFAEFPFSVAAQLHHDYTGTFPLFAGKAMCPSGLTTSCSESYGAAVFSIEEIDNLLINQHSKLSITHSY